MEMRESDLRTFKLLQQRHCPECGGTTVLTDPAAGEVMCRACGLVLDEDHLDQSPEWRAFSPDEQRARVRSGPPTSLRYLNGGLATTFLPRHDPSGNVLPFPAQQTMQRLQRWQHRAQTQSSHDRNLTQAMTELARLADYLNIPSTVTEHAAFLYRKALHQNLVRGRSIHAITAASLYLACRLTQLPRQLTMFADANEQPHARARVKEISRYYRLLQRALNLEIPVDDPTIYLPKIASNLGLTQRIQNTAIQLIHSAKQRHAVVGKNPVSIAAAALYIAARGDATPVTQKAVAAAAEVTEVTIRNRYKSLTHALELEFTSQSEPAS